MTADRAVLLSRVSGERQGGEERYSLGAQQRAMHEYCEREVIEIVAEFEEPGTSAFTPDITKIPGLHSAIKLIEAGGANLLIVHESSRLARNERLTNEIADRLEAVRARLIDVSMSGLDFTTPEGRMVLSQNGNLNSYMSRKISQQSQKGKLEQFNRGLQVGAIPFGYRKGTILVAGQETPSRSVPAVAVPAEAAAIRQAFDDHILGKSPNTIAREWNAAGFKPRSVKGIDRFQSQTVRGILSNSFYCGYVWHRGERHPGQHLPIISEELFERAQRPPRRQKEKRVHPPALLAGVARCGACGQSIYGHRVRRSRKQTDIFHVYYREPSRDFNRDCPDAGLLWRMEEVDRQVNDVVRSLGLDKDWLDRVEQQAKKVPPDSSQGERERIRSTLRRLQREYLAGRLPEEEYEEIRRDLEWELSRLPVAFNAVSAAASQMKSFADLWDSGSAQARNEICQTVFESVELNMREKKVAIMPWPEFEPLFSFRRSVYVGQGSPAPGSQ